MLGAVGTLPEIYTELEISYFLLRRLLGVRTEGDKKGAKVSVPVLRKLKSLTFSRILNSNSSMLYGAGMMQWSSSPTSVAWVRFPPSA